MAWVMKSLASRTASKGSAPRARLAVIAAENTQPLPCVFGVSMRWPGSSISSAPSK